MDAFFSQVFSAEPVVDKSTYRGQLVQQTRDNRNFRQCLDALYAVESVKIKVEIVTLL
jgi:hypothetical protein